MIGLECASWYRTIAEAVLFQGSLLDRAAIELTGRAPLPPAPLRWRVHGTPDLASFLQTGDRCAKDIDSALRHAGRNLEEFWRILDFGCGCGRLLMPVRRLAPLAGYHGCDLDVEAIEWDSRNLPYAAFAVNRQEPPLDFPSNSFDLVYAISVFTHLDEGSQFRWLEELQRIIRPSGILLVTVHGYGCWKSLPPDQVGTIERNGIAVVWEPLLEVFSPHCAKTTYHTKDYVLREFQRYFHVLDYLPQAMNHHQDVVLLERSSIA